MMRRLVTLLVTLWLVCFGGLASALDNSISVAELPPEARETLRLIDQHKPLPYIRDGAFFGNYERRLPEQKGNYYREYTVPTPGAKNRGARRIVTGQMGERYYTADHYQHFQRIRE